MLSVPPSRAVWLYQNCFIMLCHASQGCQEKTYRSRKINWYHELTPFMLQEVGNATTLWLRGGYPLSFLAGDDQESFSWREAFIRTYLEMDIPQLGVRVPATQLRRFWTMVAHNHGQLWNANQIANSLGVSAPTVRHYLDILDDTFIVRQLQPYHANIKKRLTKSPKVYIRDSGLLHALLRVKTLDDL